MHSKRTKSSEPTTVKVAPEAALQTHLPPEDRYPGTFFRVPGVPVPGKTTWSIIR